MTIQQLVLTSSKAISVLMLKDLCSSNTRAGRGQRSTEKRKIKAYFKTSKTDVLTLGPKPWEWRIQNVPITKSVIYARRKNFYFFGTKISWVPSKPIFFRLPFLLVYLSPCSLQQRTLEIIKPTFNYVKLWNTFSCFSS